jgi:hypothetical protein
MCGNLANEDKRVAGVECPRIGSELSSCSPLGLEREYESLGPISAGRLGVQQTTPARTRHLRSASRFRWLYATGQIRRGSGGDPTCDTRPTTDAAKSAAFMRPVLRPAGTCRSSGPSCGCCGSAGLSLRLLESLSRGAWTRALGSIWMLVSMNGKIVLAVGRDFYQSIFDVAMLSLHNDGQLVRSPSLATILAPTCADQNTTRG